VIIATDRAMRPTDFVRETVLAKGGQFCPFCPGNEQKTPPEILAFRPNGGGSNEPGWNLRVVPNKFPALRVEGNLNRQGEGVYDKMNGVGAHEVFVETPEHSLTFGELPEKQAEDLFWAFRDRIVDLRKDRRLTYVLIFKNHGEAAGASLEHTHSQLIALPVVPKRVREEMDGAKRYFDFKERCIYCDIVRQEAETGPRVVLETDHYLAIAPYASRFPFETWILPKKHDSHFEEIEASSIQNVAGVQRTIIRKIDKALPQRPHSRGEDGPLPLAHRDHPEADKDSRFRVGNGVLHQPHAAGNRRKVPARRGSGLVGVRRRAC
jgi:UDPglucose--hexose-1-phosphate uridylyltransferase